jgi:Spy/CpxP family protein refolding chaperone
MIRFRSLSMETVVRTVVAGLLLLTSALGLAAQGPRGGGPLGRGERGLGPGGGVLALGAAELTDAQRQQIREIRERHRDQTQAAAEQLAAARNKLNEAVETLPPNEGLITAAGQDLAQAEVDAAIQQARVNAEIWPLLTPDQQAQVAKARAEREARAADRRERIRTRRAQ